MIKAPFNDYRVPGIPLPSHLRILPRSVFLRTVSPAGTSSIKQKSSINDIIINGMVLRNVKTGKCEGGRERDKRKVNRQTYDVLKGVCTSLS